MPHDIAHVRFRNTHPILFRGLLFKSVLLLVLGISFIILPPARLVDSHYLAFNQNADHPLIPFAFWGGTIILAALMTIFGISRGLKRYKYARYGLILGASIIGIFAAAYWFAFLEGVVPSISTPVLYTYVSGTLAIWVSEPAFNPVSSALMHPNDYDIEALTKRMKKDSL